MTHFTQIVTAILSTVLEHRQYHSKSAPQLTIFDAATVAQLLSVARACIAELRVYAADPKKAGSQAGAVNSDTFCAMLGNTTALVSMLPGCRPVLTIPEAHVAIRHSYDLEAHVTGRTSAYNVAFSTALELADGPVPMPAHASPAVRAALLAFLHCCAVTPDPAALDAARWTVMLAGSSDIGAGSEPGVWTSRVGSTHAAAAVTVQWITAAVCASPALRDAISRSIATKV